MAQLGSKVLKSFLTMVNSIMIFFCRFLFSQLSSMDNTRSEEYFDEQHSDSNEGLIFYHVAWTPPCDDFWKLNFSGILLDGIPDAGVGCVLRNENAKFIAACAAPIRGCQNVLVAGFVALAHGLLMAIKLGVDYLEIEGDFEDVIEIIERESSDYLSLPEVESCLQYKAQIRRVRFRLVGLDDNQVANKFAIDGVGLEELEEWVDEPPPGVPEILVADVIGRWLVQPVA